MEAPPEGFRQHRFVAPPDATRVLLVRHGESQPVQPDRPFPLLEGHGDPPLAPVGQDQARRVAERLAVEPIAAIYVTILRRTHQTAAPLAERLGLEPRVERDLREVHLGEWEGGMLRVHAAAGHPTVRELFARERWDVIPGAEPAEDFRTRTRRGLARVVEAHRGETVVAVVHGGVIGQLLHDATGSRPFAFAGADNGSISELVVSTERTVVRRFNDIAHLDGIEAS